MAVGIFAGIPVKDYSVALEWYQRLLGSEPSFYPNDIEAVWQLADDCHVYIIQDIERAGGVVNMIWVDDPVSEVARIAARGLEPSTSRSTTQSGSTSSTTPTATRRASVARSHCRRKPRRQRSQALLQHFLGHDEPVPSDGAPQLHVDLGPTGAGDHVARLDLSRQATGRAVNQ